jgi:cytochrome subunit of sulfide dehydrogenase
MSAKRAVAATLFASVLAACPLAPAIAAAPPGASACTGCHPASPGVVSPVPPLAGLDAAYIVRTLQEFRAGSRPATVMDRIAKGFDDDEIRAIADWYARQR